jgi:hypothetical protein
MYNKDVPGQIGEGSGHGFRFWFFQFKPFTPIEIGLQFIAQIFIHFGIDFFQIAALRPCFTGHPFGQGGATTVGVWVWSRHQKTIHFRGLESELDQSIGL